MYQNIPTKVLTNEVRLSYVSLTTPRAGQDPGSKAKYSATLLIPKTDTATYQNILSSIEAAAAEAQGKIWNGVRPPVLPHPLHDGDGVRESGVPYGDECKGHWVMTASSVNKPQVVDSDGATELLPQDIYSGMYARVTFNFYGYLNSGKKGVGCGLGNVMKTRDGEALAGGASAAVDFAGVATPNYGAAVPATPGAAGYAPAAPAYGGVPAGAAPIPAQPAGAINPLTGLPY
jgi:hypothetical protein